MFTVMFKYNLYGFNQFLFSRKLTIKTLFEVYFILMIFIFVKYLYDLGYEALPDLSAWHLLKVKVEGSLFLNQVENFAERLCPFPLTVRPYYKSYKR